MSGCATPAIDKCRPNSGPPPIECDNKELIMVRQEVAEETLKRFERLCLTLEFYSKIFKEGQANKEIKEGLRNCYFVFNQK